MTAPLVLLGERVDRDRSWSVRVTFDAGTIHPSGVVRLSDAELRAFVEASAAALGLTITEG